MSEQEAPSGQIRVVGICGSLRPKSHTRMALEVALHALRDIGRALHAWVIPEQASIPQARQVFDEHGKLTDSQLQNRLLEVGRQVARFAFLHTSEKALDFLRLWEGAPVNPGGGKA